MAPTFRLLLGVPGPSSALAVALRHGLPEPVIARAKALLPTQALDRETALRELARERAELEALRHEAERETPARDGAARKRSKTERHAFREQAAREVEQEVRELRTSVRAARKELDGVRSRIRATPKLGRGGAARARARAQPSRRPSRHRRTFAELAQASPRPPRRASSPRTSLRIGQTVLHRTLGATGQIIELCARDQVRLMVGGMKLLVGPVRDLSSQPRAAKVCDRRPDASPKRIAQPSRNQTAPAPKDASHHPDLRGERVDEAVVASTHSWIACSPQRTAGFVLHGHGTAH